MSVIQILGNTDRSEVDRKMDQYHTENLAEQRKLAKEHQDKMDKIRRQNSEILRKMESMRTHIDNTQAGGGPDLPVIQHMQAGAGEAGYGEAAGATAGAGEDDIIDADFEKKE